MQRLPKLAALTAEDSGWGFFLCTYKELRAGRSGSEFLFLSLQDSSGQVVAKLMADVDRYKNEFDAGEFVRVEGRGSLYNGQVQLVLSTIRRVNPEQDRREGFREEDASSARRGRSTRCGRSSRAPARVKNDHVRVLLNRMVADHEAQLRVWPAAQVIHHAYRGGFLEHITKMAEVGRFVARAYGADWDLVLAGVVLHDIGKLQELAYEGGAASYTRDGNLVGHIALGIVMVREAINGISGFPDDLRAQIEHLIASHHGTREHGSPVEPKTIEAFIVAIVDELDAKLNQVRRAIGEDPSDEEFTAWHKRLGRVIYKGVPGSIVPRSRVVQPWNLERWNYSEPSANVIVPLTTTLPLTVARPSSTPMRLRRRLTLASTITTSPGCTGAAEAHALHAAEEDQLILVLGLGEDQDGAYLSHGLRQDGWRQRRAPVAGPRQVRLVRSRRS